MLSRLRDRAFVFCAIFLIVGVWATHLLHLFRFWKVDWSHISALPDYRISITLSFWLGFLLIPILAATVAVLDRFRVLWVFVLCFLTTEVVSQVLGRSLIKFVIDVGLWCTVAGNHIVRRLYGKAVVDKTSPKALPVLHSESLGVLGSTATVCMFVIGTLGVTVASNFLSRYFAGELGQGTAWFYVGSIIYLAFGMYSLLIVPLFKTVIRVRERINREV